MQKYNYTIIETPIGFIAPVWIAEPRFYLLRLCIVDSFTSVTHMFKEFEGMGFDNGKSSHPHVEQLEKSLDLYFSSKINIEFSSYLLCLENFSVFTRTVLLALKNIPFGQVISYGQLAELSGHPKAFRAVGSVMNKNPFPLIIPCHRVIRSNGNTGEFALGKDMKEYLLQHESVS